MDELVERLTRATCKARGIDPDNDPRSWEVRLDVVACLSAIEASGTHRVAPVEPTEEMIRAGVRAVGCSRGSYDEKMAAWYRASIAASPKQGHAIYDYERGKPIVRRV